MLASKGLTHRFGHEDFATLGRWLAQARTAPAAQPIPAAALLEGGYHEDLPLLIDAFLTAWNNPA